MDTSRTRSQNLHSRQNGPQTAERRRQQQDELSQAVARRQEQEEQSQAEGEATRVAVAPSNNDAADALEEDMVEEMVEEMVGGLEEKPPVATAEDPRPPRLEPAALTVATGTTRVFRDDGSEPISLAYEARLRAVSAAVKCMLVPSEFCSMAECLSLPFPTNCRLMNTLFDYFCVENADGTRAAPGFFPNDPTTYRRTKLVYVLTHKYPSTANLRLEDLRGQDAAVAAQLSLFCASSGGAVALFTCTMEDPSPRTRLDHVKLSGFECVCADGVRTIKPVTDIDFFTAVVPCGAYASSRLNVPGQTGPAALVLAPVEERAIWELVFAPRERDLFFSTFMKLADLKPTHARAMAYALDEFCYTMSTADPHVQRMLMAVAKLNDFKVVVSVLSTFYLLEFQPMLRRVVRGFDVAKVVKTLDQKWRVLRCCAGPNVVNFIASVLDGVVDPRMIAPVLDAVRVGARVESGDFDGQRGVNPTELSRLFALASRVSVSQMWSIVGASNTYGLVLVVGPALELLLHSPEYKNSKVTVTTATLYIKFVQEQLSKMLVPRELVSTAEKVIDRIKPVVTKLKNERAQGTE